MVSNGLHPGVLSVALSILGVLWIVTTVLHLYLPLSSSYFDENTCKINFTIFKIQRFKKLQVEVEMIGKPARLPGWYGSVGSALAYELRSHWFDYRSGHMPGLWARSPVGGVQKVTS